jgi:hypothetical protein
MPHHTVSTLDYIACSKQVILCFRRLSRLQPFYKSNRTPPNDTVKSDIVDGRFGSHIVRNRRVIKVW